MALRKRPLPLTDHIMSRSFTGTVSGTFKKDGLVVTRSGALTNALGVTFESNTSVDDIQFHDTIGQGAAGTVRLAVHKQTRTVVAVKIINYLESAEKRKQLVSELKAFLRLQAPNLVRLYAAFSDSANVYLALEYMDLGSLSSLMKSLVKLPENYLSMIVYQVLTGLAYMHFNKFIHRDVKPGNILISSEGWVKVSDFGLASDLLTSRAMASSYVGTAGYMSPERMGSGQYSYNSDIWAIGLIVYEATTGKYPYPLGPSPEALTDAIADGPPPTLRNQQYSPELIDFIDLCLIKDQNKRPLSGYLGRHPFMAKYNPDDMPQVSELAKWFASMTTVL